MRTSPVTVAMLGVLLGCGASVRTPRTRLTPKEMVQQSKPAIVRIEVFDAEGKPGLGTGFFVTSDGRVATNLHVIQGSVKADVVMWDGTRHPVRRVVAIDEQHDLAVVGIDFESEHIMRIGNSDEVEAGDPVFAIGNPLGADYTISDGLISAVRRLDSMVVLQISAPISQGSSGGPLLNHYGEVIGVATLVSAEGQNLNFGMPSNYLQPLLRQPSAISYQQFVGDSTRLLKDTISDLQRSQGGAGAPPPRPERRIPIHQLSLLDGCSDDELKLIARELIMAIEKGAPLYNSGDHEACFRIYEGAALRLESGLSPACRGGREALGQGLLRSETLETYTNKAWAMRDAFDGLLDVIKRRLAN